MAQYAKLQDASAFAAFRGDEGGSLEKRSAVRGIAALLSLPRAHCERR